MFVNLLSTVVLDLRDSDCKEVDLSFGQGNLYTKISSIIARETVTATVT